MITWDFSGCMSRESVGVTHYRRHTNRLINITVAHLLTMQIHHAMHQNKARHRDWTFSRCTRWKSAVIVHGKLALRSGEAWQRTNSSRVCETACRRHRDWTWQAFGDANESEWSGAAKRAPPGPPSARCLTSAKLCRRTEVSGSGRRASPGRKWLVIKSSLLVL